jgi:hypothetical protein
MKEGHMHTQPLHHTFILCLKSGYRDSMTARIFTLSSLAIADG